MNTARYPSSLDRLEARIQGNAARIEVEAGRIDDLYWVLERAGLLSEDAVQPEEARCRPRRRRPVSMHAGTASGGLRADR